MENMAAVMVDVINEVNDKIVGYAYASAYSGRDAYAWTVTTSIYLDKDYRRHGIGTALYEKLENRLREQGIVNMLAGAAYCEKEDEYLSHDSFKFHSKIGFTKVLFSTLNDASLFTLNGAICA